HLESLLMFFTQQPQKPVAMGSDTSQPYQHGEPTLSLTGAVGESSNFGQRPEARLRRLELPLFDGTNPDGWVCQAERYFLMHQMIDNERLAAAIISLDGDALSWF
ncbi:hypothetical protein TorRG33x02_250240, partial [Trema orientale]